jgi:hypothetical protein
LRSHLPHQPQLSADADPPATLLVQLPLLISALVLFGGIPEPLRIGSVVEFDHPSVSGQLSHGIVVKYNVLDTKVVTFLVQT